MILAGGFPAPPRGPSGKCEIVPGGGMHGRPAGAVSGGTGPGASWREQSQREQDPGQVKSLSSERQTRSSCARAAGGP